MASQGAENYAADVERIGWGQRIVQFFRWKPSTYRQVWLFAVPGFGVPGFIIWTVVGRHPLYAASIVCRYRRSR